MTKRICYIDCVGGIAGDMLLSALVDSGAERSLIDYLPKLLDFSDVKITWTRKRPSGFASQHVRVDFDPSRHPHSRNIKDIVEILNKADIPEQARNNAIAVFTQLAEAEAKAHGVRIEESHFHEVGAVDAIIDILGICLLLENLKIDEIICSPLPMGRGSIQCAHGTIPLPAPAVAEMLIDIPVFDAGVEAETVTPTGAAIVATLAKNFSAMPSMIVKSRGIGGGTREFPGIPNIVRVFIGETSDTKSEIQQSDNYIIECNIDDLEPRVYPFVMERLFASGALDAYITPIVMKKGRPAHLITVLCDSGSMQPLIDVLLAETTTLGCRIYPVRKFALERSMSEVETPWGVIPLKLAIKDGEIIRRIPEYDICAQLARKAGIPVRDVIEAAMSGDSIEL